MLYIKDGYMLREVAEEYVVVPVGAAAKQFTGMIRLNSTAALLWELLRDGATEDSLVGDLCEEFAGEEGFSAELARRDVQVFVAQLREQDLLLEKD